MLCHFKKFYVILSLCMLSSAHAMENQLFDKYNKTVIQARQKNFPPGLTEEIICLLENGANPNWEVEEQTILLHALHAIEDQNEKLLAYLLARERTKKDVDLNAPDSDSFTALHYILENIIWTKKFNEELFKELIILGADPHANTPDTVESPIHIVARHGYDDALKTFIRHGADVNRKNDGSTPLGNAIWFNNPTTVELLCKAGAPLNDIENHCESAGVRYKNINAFQLAILKYKDSDPSSIMNIFNTLIMHACPRPPISHKQSKEKKHEFQEIIATTYFLLAKKLGPDITLRIVEEVVIDALDSFRGFEKKMCATLFRKNFVRPLIYHTNKRIQYLLDVLQTPDSVGKTALHYLQQTYPDEACNKLEPIISGRQLQENLYVLNQAFSSPDPYKRIKEIPESNLAFKIYKNCVQKLLKK